MKKSRSRYDQAVLASKSFAEMTKGERIAAAKVGLIPPVRTERERQLRTRYGLTLEAYDDLLALQGLLPDAMSYADDRFPGKAA